MKFYKQLIDAICTEDFYKTNEILLSISKEDDSLDYVDNLLLFMEDNPDIDYGMPGPIVHYMEKYYLSGYEDLLYESVKRKPTIHTLWMLNRIVNSPELVDKSKYINLLTRISDNQNEPEIIRKEALFYLNYQTNQGL